MCAAPRTSGTIPSSSPTATECTPRTSKLVPMRLSIVTGEPSSSSPRATSAAARELTPVPVGERTTSPTAKTQTLRLWSGSA